VNGRMSCASCHQQALAFSDGLAHPLGATGDAVARSSMSLVNVAYYYPYTWQNPKPHTLEEQALIPLFGEVPLELGLTRALDDVLTTLQAEPRYGPLFPRAFPDENAPFSADSIVKALASFERTIISGGKTPFPRTPSAASSCSIPSASSATTATPG